MVRRRYVLILDVVLVALLPICAVLSTWMIDSLSGCFLQKYGLLCPACGGTRCVMYFTRAEFLKAFRMNPYLFLTVPILIFMIVLLNLVSLSGGRFGKIGLKKMCRPENLIVWAVGFAAFGVLRNFF